MNAPSRQIILDILLVEDQSDDRELVSHLLKKHMDDIRITCEDRHKEVIKLLKQRNFDLMIVDFNLKGYTGLELIDEVRALKGFDVPIIMITGDESEDVALRSLQHGVDDFVIKTLKGVKDLPEIIRRTIKRADIHKMKYTSENRIINSEDIFQNLYDNATELIFTIWPDGTFVNVNEATLTALGINRRDVGLKNFVEFIDSANRGQFKSALNALFNDQKTADIELKLRTGDNKAVNVSGRGHPNVVNGKVVATNWIFKNVTSEKYLEQLVWEDYGQYSGIFDYIPVAVMLSDRRGVILQANAIAGQLLGYTPAEMRGLRIEDITHPDDVKITLEYHKKLMDGQVTGYTMEKRYKTRSGNYIWVEISGSLVKNSSGKPLYGIAHVKDISELKQFEELLGKLAEDLISVRGEYLFDRLSARLVELLHADFVFIVSIQAAGHTRKLHTVLLRDKLKNLPDPEFHFPEELLDELLTGNELVITGQLTRKGMRTSAFARQHANDLVAIPLHNDAGDTIGILGAIYKKPTHNHSMITTLLRIAGTKISDQLQLPSEEQPQEASREIASPGSVISH